MTSDLDDGEDGVLGDGKRGSNSGDCGCEGGDSMSFSRKLMGGLDIDPLASFCERTEAE